MTKENLEEFTRRFQTSRNNIMREYGQHMFLSYLYQEKKGERLLFKGGTALRIVMKSPRFSEDLDFTGVGITQREIETLFADTLARLEKVGFRVALNTAKETTGGYLGNATLDVFGWQAVVHIEVSLRNGKKMNGVQSVIENDYIPSYTLVHLDEREIIQGKLEALFNRHKPRDFYDYFFLLSLREPPPATRQRETLTRVLSLLRDVDIDFRSELKQFLPASHAMIMRDFKGILERKIRQYL